MRTSCFLVTGLLALAGLSAQDLQLHVELMNQVGTATSRQGDMVSARVVNPPALRGDIVEGRVAEARSGAKLGGRSVLDLDFVTLRHAGEVIPINSQVQSASNSKGRANVDDEGRVVRRGTGNVAKVGAASGLGAALGGLAGRGRGAAIGAAAGGAAGVALIGLAADAPNVTFLPGSRFVLSARARDNRSLAGLTAVPAPAPRPAPQPAVVASAAPQPQPQAARQPAPSTAAAGGAAPQPDLTAVKADFIPGEKTILLDDLTDMAGDEPPPHWKVRGGTAELRKGGEIRQLTFTARRTDLTPNIPTLPANFTVELNTRMVGHDSVVYWEFRKKTPGVPAMVLRLAAHYDKLMIHCATPTEAIFDGQVRMDWSQPIQTALWLQNGRLRFYVNGARLFDVNQITFPQLVAPQLTIAVSPDPKSERFVGILYARFAESTPDFSQVITANGRYVSHGILFDNDSDRLKPESSAVIRMIAGGLEKNPNLKLCIEGHTDSVGDPAHNLDLSRRRAEAVKTVLVQQFQVDAARLTTEGKGAAKPIDSNDTAQGRAQNRRVEFARVM